MWAKSLNMTFHSHELSKIIWHHWFSVEREREIPIRGEDASGKIAIIPKPELLRHFAEKFPYNHHRFGRDDILPKSIVPNETADLPDIFYTLLGYFQVEQWGTTPFSGNRRPYAQVL